VSKHVAINITNKVDLTAFKFFNYRDSILRHLNSTCVCNITRPSAGNTHVMVYTRWQLFRFTPTHMSFYPSSTIMKYKNTEKKSLGTRWVCL